MASVTRFFRFNKNLSKIPIQYLSTVRYYSAHGDDSSIPDIKPPGPEWIDQKWKDDGLGHGDYPNYKEFSYQLRDPYKKYWDQQDRRDFGEPLHIEHDILSVWMPDESANHAKTYGEMFFHLCLAFGALGVLLWFSECVYDAKSRDTAVPKPYPYNNLYLEMGGDPNRMPTKEELTRRIPTPMYGW
nr:NADH dehydrogenase [ubiquinone] 1 beta subcomplex subunit 8, mitochondrial [Hydra vulgaris]